MIHLANKIVVGLDLTEMDNLILDYLHTLTNRAGEHPDLVITHNIKYELDDDVNDLLDQPLQTIIYEELLAKIQERLPNYQGDCQLLVTQEGSTIEAFETAIKQHNADLLVVGKKLTFDGSGITTARIMRLNLCSVLVIPEGTKLEFSRVLFPIDFSKNSARALHLGMQMLTQAKDFEVKALHVYHIPQVYFPYIPVKTTASGMDKKAKEEYKHFIAKNKLKSKELPCDFIDGKGNSVVKNIVAEARNFKAHLITVGSKGDSNFVGNVALGLAQFETKIPILFVK